MTKTQIKKAENHELVMETISTYGKLIKASNAYRGTKQLQSNFEKLIDELQNRELLKPEQVELMKKYF